MKREALLLPSPSPNPINPRFTSDLNSNFLHLSLDGAAEDTALLPAEILSREEVLRRRSRRVRKLERFYRDQYWALTEELRAKHREYCWTFGVSPLEEGNGPGLEKDASAAAAGREGSRENGVAWKGFGSRCGFAGCRSRAMPLTRFCHPHVLSDGRQTLYKACTFVVKSAPTGSIICGKPVLRAAVPSLCSMHFKRAQKSVLQALKKAGVSSSKSTPNFHVIIAECIHQIQSKRRAALSTAAENVAVKDENVDDIRMGHELLMQEKEKLLYISAPTGSIICGKPVLRAAVPSLCSMHFKRAQKSVLQALKKAGVSSSKSTPNFHVIIAECIHQIQSKRRAALSTAAENVAVKDENVG
ncbi:putative INO80 complex subunit D [Cocos nucifera]|nr:putative INO80 complex subunit D [Cocos nucifera]